MITVSGLHFPQAHTGCNNSFGEVNVSSEQGNPVSFSCWLNKMLYFKKRVLTLKKKINTPRRIFQLSWLFRYYILLRSWEHLTSLQYQYALIICATHLFCNWSKLCLACSAPNPILLFPLQQPLVYLRFHYILSSLLVQVTWSHSHFPANHPFQLLVDQIALY